jgi:hypothetical protein
MRGEVSLAAAMFSDIWTGFVDRGIFLAPLAADVQRMLGDLDFK